MQLICTHFTGQTRGEEGMVVGGGGGGGGPKGKGAERTVAQSLRF